MPKLPLSSPRTFSESYRQAVLEPAVDRATDSNGNIDPNATLEGAASLATPALQQAGGVAADTFLSQATQTARDAASVAAGPDGRLSKNDAEQMPPDLRLAYHFMKTGALPATATPAVAHPKRTTDGTRVNYTPGVFDDVRARYDIQDPQALVDLAAKTGDGNSYLNRTELEDAATALKNQAPNLSLFDWSDNVVTKVANEFGIGDVNALLRTATRFDADGNRYLKRSELEAAAKSMTGMLQELGIISDIDKTLLPPHTDRSNLPPPYPGIMQLLVELEANQPGDIHYVTARNQQTVDRDDIPGWMTNAGLPPGSIDTGISGIPQIARREKVKDISVHMDAAPQQPFVLFGDNSHADHLVYKDLIDKYPGRVTVAFIHNVKQRTIPQDKDLILIDNYAEAAEMLLQRGALSPAAARRVMVSAQVEGLNITDAEIETRLATATQS